MLYVEKKQMLKQNKTNKKGWGEGQTKNPSGFSAMGAERPRRGLAAGQALRPRRHFMAQAPSSAQGGSGGRAGLRGLGWARGPEAGT